MVYSNLGMIAFAFSSFFFLLQLVTAITEALQYASRKAVEEIEPQLAKCTRGMDVMKLSKMYWAQEEEDLAREKEEEALKEEAKIREAYDIKRNKRELREKKFAESCRRKCLREQKGAEEDSRERGSEAYTEMIEETEGGTQWKKEESEAAGAKEVLRTNKEIKKKYDSMLKERKEKEDQRMAKVWEKRGVEIRANNKILFKWLREEKEKPVPVEKMGAIVEEGLLGLDPDKLLLRWCKYHLRRSIRSGFRYRRKVENFGGDLRDGVSASVIMHKVR